MERISSVLGLVTFSIALAGTASAFAADIDIAASKSTPAGQTYGRWAAEWWQWALGVPAAEDPVVDTTGQFCAQRQVDDVWFLAGSFGPVPVVRNCKVPAGKSLFFPLINQFAAAFLNDPPKTRTEKFLRGVARCTEPAQISLRIDGSKVPKELLVFTGGSGSQSPLFNVQLPPDTIAKPPLDPVFVSSNIFGLTQNEVPELLLSPTAEEGYYVFLYPLRQGPHTIAWTASGCAPGFSQDITYHLTVVGSPH